MLCFCHELTQNIYEQGIFAVILSSFYIFYAAAQNSYSHKHLSNLFLTKQLSTQPLLFSAVLVGVSNKESDNSINFIVLSVVLTVLSEMMLQNVNIIHLRVKNIGEHFFDNQKYVCLLYFDLFFIRFARERKHVKSLFCLFSKCCYFHFPSFILR